MKSKKYSFDRTSLGSLAMGNVPVCFPGRDFPTQSPAGDYKEFHATCTDSSVCWQRPLFGLPLSGCLIGCGILS